MVYKVTRSYAPFPKTYSDVKPTEKKAELLKSGRQKYTTVMSVIEEIIKPNNPDPLFISKN